MHSFPERYCSLVCMPVSVYRKAICPLTNYQLKVWMQSCIWMKSMISFNFLCYEILGWTLHKYCKLHFFNISMKITRLLLLIKHLFSLPEVFQMFETLRFHLAKPDITAATLVLCYTQAVCPLWLPHWRETETCLEVK